MAAARYFNSLRLSNVTFTNFMPAISKREHFVPTFNKCIMSPMYWSSCRFSLCYKLSHPGNTYWSTINNIILFNHFQKKKVTLFNSHWSTWIFWIPLQSHSSILRTERHHWWLFEKRQCLMRMCLHKDWVEIRVRREMYVHWHCRQIKRGKIRRRQAHETSFVSPSHVSEPMLDFHACTFALNHSEHLQLLWLRFMWSPHFLNLNCSRYLN